MQIRVIDVAKSQRHKIKDWSEVYSSAAAFHANTSKVRGSHEEQILWSCSWYRYKQHGVPMPVAWKIREDIPEAAVIKFWIGKLFPSSPTIPTSSWPLPGTPCPTRKRLFLLDGNLQDWLTQLGKAQNIGFSITEYILKKNKIFLLYFKNDFIFLEWALLPRWVRTGHSARTQM